MKAFADLYTALDETNRTGEKVAALARRSVSIECDETRIFGGDQVQPFDQLVIPEVPVERVVGGDDHDGRLPSRALPLTLATSESVDVAAVALGGAAGASVALGEQRLERVAFWWWWAVVDETLRSECCTDPFGDHLRHVDDAVAACEARLDVVADTHHRRRLGGLSVDVHMAAATCVGRFGPCLRQSNRVQPGIDPSTLTAHCVRLDGRSAVRQRGDGLADSRVCEGDFACTGQSVVDTGDELRHSPRVPRV